MIVLFFNAARLGKNAISCMKNKNLLVDQMKYKDCLLCHFFFLSYVLFQTILSSAILLSDVTLFVQDNCIVGFLPLFFAN